MSEWMDGRLCRKVNEPVSEREVSGCMAGESVSELVGPG